MGVARDMLNAGEHFGIQAPAMLKGVCLGGD